jgi:hypothetical protein
MFAGRHEASPEALSQGTATGIMAKSDGFRLVALAADLGDKAK